MVDIMMPGMGSPIFRRIREQNSPYQPVATAAGAGRMGTQLLILLVMIVVALASILLT